MKRIALALMFVLALVFAGCGSTGSTGAKGPVGAPGTVDDSVIINLQTQIDELIIQVNTLAEAVSGQITQAQVDALQNQINSLTSQLAALQAQVGIDNVTITAEIANLTERIEVLEGTVTILQAKVDGQAVEIAALVEQINTLNAQVENLLIRIAILEQDVPCNEGSAVYTGAGDPKGTASVGDLYFDTYSGPDKKHSVWIYSSTGWVFYGQIEK